MDPVASISIIAGAGSLTAGIASRLVLKMDADLSAGQTEVPEKKDLDPPSMARILRKSLPGTTRAQARFVWLVALCIVYVALVAATLVLTVPTSHWTYWVALFLGAAVAPILLSIPLLAWRGLRQVQLTIQDRLNELDSMLQTHQQHHPPVPLPHV